jgi:multiple sugar transport system substrate-binding protein
MNQGISFFDKDLNYRRNTDNFVRSFDLAKTITQEELYLGQGIWSGEGQQSIKNGKLISIFLGSWGIGQTRDWGGPEQEGKWRATGLPFGAYGGSGGSTVSILSQSKNKELAWEFVKFALASEEGQRIFTEKGSMPGWKPAWELNVFKDRKEAYLGGQNLNLVAATLLEKVPPSFETPLDATAQGIWSQGINDLLDKNLDSKAQLQKIEEDIMAAVSAEYQKLLDARK